jgi:hypothetical protein
MFIVLAASNMFCNQAEARSTKHVSVGRTITTKLIDADVAAAPVTAAGGDSPVATARLSRHRICFKFTHLY